MKRHLLFAEVQLMVRDGLGRTWCVRRSRCHINFVGSLIAAEITPPACPFRGRFGGRRWGVQGRGKAFERN